MLRSLTTTQPDTAALPVGSFGADTGAGAALTATADPEDGTSSPTARSGVIEGVKAMEAVKIMEVQL
ncbi:hypothetical protein PJK45_10355 [Mycobacterium kansasii]|uniref:Uncharacterized protein n=3 Tax=Mycobacterium kansasii TaxID=1768 RepID=A0A1V3WNX1_MYCKA|nr:hypothetical protein [Mycobacterium kansasii]EUA04300.1 hypothetical protein I547_1927 [Mycobacterium kansasii 824]AGZ54310.1 hypothetical protein MKAN_17740 [Mycobacterium kansasii ATCC 12478]ARG56374.1 hypothetical protein B1T43_11430 [Mycobacterium kansasii]ARG61825.1 hypothetical protein B1T45_11515 [Mycobacterium kansasii]ARG69512.1 hypothetical protein B1T47_11170 [Mycobacterium kansasii]